MKSRCSFPCGPGRVTGVAALFVPVAVAAFVGVLGGGCGTDPSTGMAASSSRRPVAKVLGAGDNPGSSFEASPAAAAMGVQNEVGVYETADIDQTLEEHMDEIRSCYRRAGRAQRYAGGKVNLRFLVDGQGTPRDVLIVETHLGNYEVERCVVAVGRSLRFPAPIGNKATSFDYPVEFRSTHEVQVQDLTDSLKVDHDVATAMHSLSPCGSVSRTGAQAIFYVDSTGAVGSVGIAASSALNEPAAACTVREMRRWHISATLPGRMLRCHLTLPGMAAYADAQHRVPLTVASRRRRR